MDQLIYLIPIIYLMKILIKIGDDSKNSHQKKYNIFLVPTVSVGMQTRVIPQSNV